MSRSSQVHYRSCHLCEAMCGVKVHLEGSRVISVRGDGQDPFSRGHICPKALALKDIHEDPDRLRQPLRRTASGWQSVPWDEALDEAADKLTAIQRQHGNEAVASYFGNPQVHSYTALLGGARLLRALRSRNRYSATSVDQLPHHLASFYLYGYQLLIPVPDLDRTDFLLVLGANPVVSNGSLMTAPDVAGRLRDLRARGGRLVVIDPRRTETAALADTHLSIRPGSDVLLLLSMLQVLFAEDLARPHRLDGIVDNIDQLRGLCRPYPPERTAAITGVPAESLRSLTRAFATAPSAVCYGRMGVSTQAFGALCQWLIQVLNILTGNLDRPGGAMFAEPAFDLMTLGSGFGQRGSFSKRHTRVRGLPEFGGEYPVAALAEEILTPGEGQIRALVTAAGNPVLSTPNGRQLESALAKLDFMLSVDIYLNETTRHAHLILPPTFGLERDHFDLVFHSLAIRNTVKYALPAFDRPPDTQHDWEIFEGLARRIENRDPVRKASWAMRWFSRWWTPRRIVALGLRRGRRGAGWWPDFVNDWKPNPGLTLSRVLRSPHGIDLGALEPVLPGRLQTLNGRIDLAPEIFLRDCSRIDTHFFVETVDHDSFLLVGRRDLRSNNSWGHNSRRLVKGPRRCTLRMHPSDGVRCGLQDGDLAEVSSRVGQVQLPVEFTDEMMLGVVSLPHGWGHGRAGTRLEVASAHAGVSANDVTDDQYIDVLSGNAALNGVSVTIRPLRSAFSATPAA